MRGKVYKDRDGRGWRWVVLPAAAPIGRWFWFTEDEAMSGFAPTQREAATIASRYAGVLHPHK
jgi:hypothetical protein